MLNSVGFWLVYMMLTGSCNRSNGTENPQGARTRTTGGNLRCKFLFNLRATGVFFFRNTKCKPGIFR